MIACFKCQTQILKYLLISFCILWFLQFLVFGCVLRSYREEDRFFIPLLPNFNHLLHHLTCGLITYLSSRNHYRMWLSLAKLILNFWKCLDCLNLEFKHKKKLVLFKYFWILASSKLLYFCPIEFVLYNLGLSIHFYYTGCWPIHYN